MGKFIQFLTKVNHNRKEKFYFKNDKEKPTINLFTPSVSKDQTSYVELLNFTCKATSKNQ